MALTGKQKAAMLLMSLDAATAAELLKDVDAEVVQELAVELAYLDASGMRDSRQNAEIARQFCNSLQVAEGFHLKAFLDTMLKSTVGNQKAEQIQTQIGNLLQERDPFILIHSADLETLASVLENEHPQATAVVLSELPARKSSEVLSLLDEGVRLSVVSRMVKSDSVTAEAKLRIAKVISSRLGSFSSGASSVSQSRGDQPLRKVAIILRNLGKDLRDGLLSAVQEKDRQAGEKVADLMILWEDIPQVTDRSLQEALLRIDPQKLSFALVRADEAITEKIKSNISERALSALEEETSAMSAPGRKDIEESRDEIISALRLMNETGKLDFIEE